MLLILWIILVAVSLFGAEWLLKRWGLF